MKIGNYWKQIIAWTLCVVIAAGLLYVVRNDRNSRVRPLYTVLLQQVYRPSDKEKMKKTLSIMKSLDSKVDIYRFYINNFKDDCFQTAYSTLHG